MKVIIKLTPLKVLKHGKICDLHLEELSHLMHDCGLL